MEKASISEAVEEKGYWYSKRVAEDEDLPYYYVMVLCFIFLFIYEGFSMPPRAAFVAGKLVIASKYWWSCIKSWEMMWSVLKR